VGQKPFIVLPFLRARGRILKRIDREYGTVGTREIPERLRTQRRARSLWMHYEDRVAVAWRPVPAYTIAGAWAAQQYMPSFDPARYAGRPFGAERIPQRLTQDFLICAAGLQRRRGFPSLEDFVVARKSRNCAVLRIYEHVVFMRRLVFLLYRLVEIRLQ